MKKKNSIIKSLLVFGLFALLISCGDDESTPVIDFASISSNFYEEEGTQTVTIPLRNASSVNGLSVSFGGTATENEDYELVGITSEGVQISVIDDDDFEENETIRVQLISSAGELSGNIFHTINIISDCADVVGIDVSYFAGSYIAIEKYGPNPPASNWYGPYALTLTQDATDPNKFIVNNFYDSSPRTAYIVFDMASGTVHFPDQTPLPDTTPNALTASTGTFDIDLCNKTTLTISLNYDGGVWEYYFEKD